MTEKLKVSREVADAIERVKINFSFEEIIASQIKTNRKGAPKWTGYFKPLNNLSAEKLAKALIVGYEVEMTSHEVIAVEAVDKACEVADSALRHTKEEMIDFALDTRNYELFMQLTSEKTNA